MQLKYYIKHPLEIGVQLLCKFGNGLSDDKYLKIMYFLRMKHRLHLDNPQTFTEKLQWLKLYDRRLDYPRMVDKYYAKKYVAEVIGEEYIIPTIGIWEKPEDIEWDSLPDKFVLKTTHGGGGDGVIICTDKIKLDVEKVVMDLNKAMRIDIYKSLKEWPYKNCERQIIAEKYIGTDSCSKDISDFKFFCFDGVVKYICVITDRQNRTEKTRSDFFDENYNHLPVKQYYDNAVRIPEQPHHFDEMKTIAEKLSKGIPHVRVDLYEVEDKIYFGEMTFFHASGLLPFEPEEWDLRFGESLQLPIIIH